LGFISNFLTFYLPPPTAHRTTTTTAHHHRPPFCVLTLHYLCTFIFYLHTLKQRIKPLLILPYN
jgi:hypothetical protein